MVKTRKAADRELSARLSVKTFLKIQKFLVRFRRLSLSGLRCVFIGGFKVNFHKGPIIYKDILGLAAYKR
jgi:hypothetical protein